MKGTACALFALAKQNRMCYEIFCDHVHNIIHNSVDHIYNRGTHMHKLVLQTEAAGETLDVIITKAKNLGMDARTAQFVHLDLRTYPWKERILEEAIL